MCQIGFYYGKKQYASKVIQILNEIPIDVEVCFWIVLFSVYFLYWLTHLEESI